MAEYFLSWSGGVDSTATGILAVLHNEPLTAMIYSRVMFDKDTPADLPEHDDFINTVAIPWFNQHGVTVEIVQSKKNFVDDFFTTRRGAEARTVGSIQDFQWWGSEYAK